MYETVDGNPHYTNVPSHVAPRTGAGAILTSRMCLDAPNRTTFVGGSTCHSERARGME